MTRSTQRLVIVLGMPRTGTTFLYHTLQSHPQLFLPHRKESYYFSINYHKGVEWFHSFYSDMPANNIGVDIGPVYFIDPASVDRILDYDPDVKVILGVRDPVSYAVSQHNQIKAFGWNVPPVEQMVRGYEWELGPGYKLVLQFGNQFMSKRIEQLREMFADNLLLYDFRTLTDSPLVVLNALEEFVGVPRFFTEDNFENVRINASSRRNILILNRLFKNQFVLDVLYRAIPNSMIRRLRRLFDRASVSSTRQQDAQEPLSDEARAALNEFFALDRQYIERLFSAGGIQLGGGRVLGTA